MTTLAGQKIREHRRATRQTLKEFGARYAVKHMAVWRWENEGRIAGTATAAALARDKVCALEDWSLPATDVPSPSLERPSLDRPSLERAA